MEKVTITWLGHASFLFETDAGEKIYIDPWIEGNPACSLTLDDIVTADIVCVTHGHVDHLGDSIGIVQKTGAMLIGTPEIGYFAHRNGIEYGKGSCPMNAGGSAKFGTVTITMTQAVHTTSIAGTEWKVDKTAEPDGGAVGYVLTFDGGEPTPRPLPRGEVIYAAGDTGIFGDMALIGQLYRPQIAILPVGGKFTMGVREAAWAASLMRPEIVIPCHYNTFPNQMADISELERQIEILAPPTRVVELKPGGKFEYSK
ncbi:metal-dependent hydrolase [Candidatus Poribacteria bacterium]|nr:metal-dependent hydrolase [Candidatus Poribacteria bacterium]